jgi:hypothetical protein
MKQRAPVPPLPILLAELVIASWETIAWRSIMITMGACSTIEYRRMVLEKLRAARSTTTALMATAGTADMAELLAPWHARATANRDRLRRR